jgi:hypothetical protein
MKIRSDKSNNIIILLNNCGKDIDYYLLIKKKSLKSNDQSEIKARNQGKKKNNE